MLKTRNFKLRASILSGAGIALTLGLISVQAQAADIFDQVTMSGATIVARFNSVAPGYRGVLAEMKGAKRIFYASPDSKYLLYGVMYDNLGKNLTLIDMQRIPSVGGTANKPKAPVAAAKTANIAPVQGHAATIDDVWLAAKNTSGITEGSGPDVYVYFDPMCPHCHGLWKKTRQFAGKSKIHWIPVSGLGPDSTLWASTLINNGRVEALTALMSGTNISPIKPDAAMQKRINFNMGAMQFTGSNQFPTILYGSGDSRRIMIGEPDAASLNKIFGGK